MRVNILTARNGGPFQWGKDLACVLNDGYAEARHIHTPLSLVMSCLHSDANIVHSTFPIPCRIGKNPTILTVQGDYTIEPNIWQRFYPGTVDRADIVTTPSLHLKQGLGLGDAVVIPNAVFPEEFVPVQHRCKDRLNLITVMNFYFPAKVKGLLNIVGILNKVGGQHFRYTIVGGGKYLDTIKSQVSRTGVDTLFTGFSPSPKSALSVSDIFLYYSHHDTFPISILEAMASGLPVITNNVGAVSEIIDNGKDGYVAENDEDYLECLLSLLDNCELRQEIGRNARAKVEAEFNWHEVVKQYACLYEGLCK